MALVRPGCPVEHVERRDTVDPASQRSEHVGGLDDGGFGAARKAVLKILIDRPVTKDAAVGPVPGSHEMAGEAGAADVDPLIGVEHFGDVRMRGSVLAGPGDDGRFVGLFCVNPFCVNPFCVNNVGKLFIVFGDSSEESMGEWRFGQLSK